MAKESTLEFEGNAFQRAIDVLERVQDREVVEVYKQYVARLEAVLGAGWLDTYVSMYQRDSRQLTNQDAGTLVLPEEIALRDRTLADPEIATLHDRYIVLLERNKLLDERYGA